MITDIDITNALLVCTEATPGPGVWAAKNDDTRAEAIERFTQHYDLARIAPGGSEVLHQVDLPIEHDADGAYCFAVTGNGPHGADNARFISAALHPEAGYAAALQELRSVRGERDALLLDLEEAAGATHHKLAHAKVETEAADARVETLVSLLGRARAVLSAVGTPATDAVYREIVGAIGDEPAPAAKWIRTREIVRSNLRPALIGAIGSLSEALDLANDAPHAGDDDVSYKQARIKDLRAHQHALEAIAADAAKKSVGDTRRPDHEMAALEIGFEIAKAMLTDGDALLIPKDELAAAIRARSIPDGEIVALAYGIMIRDTMGRSVSWRDRPQVCGWCVAAAGDTDEAEAAAERFNLATAKLHTLNCHHNPLAAYHIVVGDVLDALHDDDTSAAQHVRTKLDALYDKVEQRLGDLRAEPGVDQECV